jgi:hypothetical protein
MLAVFDNDGTICDTQEVEGACYAKAIERVTGKSLATLDWTTYEEPTSSAIVLDLPEIWPRLRRLQRSRMNFFGCSKMSSRGFLAIFRRLLVLFSSSSV